MKKFILFISILFIINLSHGQVSFGVKSGINIATTKDLIAYPKNRVGWYAGGVATITLHKKFFLQPELLYSTKGDKSSNQIGLSKIVTRFNYLAIPIHLGYNIDRKTSLLFGPEFGYLISARSIYSKKEGFDVYKNYPPKIEHRLRYWA